MEISGEEKRSLMTSCRGGVLEELDSTLVFNCPHHELYIESIKSIYYKNITRVQFVHIFAADYKYVVFFLCRCRFD